MMIFGSLAKPIALELDRSDATKFQSRTLLQFGIAWGKRRWWHTKALLPILGIMFLTVVCLMFLQIHWISKKLVTAFAKLFNSVQGSM
ncbi:MAG: hypothetical protein KME13_19975 [Myxacorys californica WJT36-NPBG1]|nr:hypothetical protein [Myxacorys californica WJT36-NPBG1]